MGILGFRQVNQNLWNLWTRTLTQTIIILIKNISTIKSPPSFEPTIFCLLYVLVFAILFVAPSQRYRSLKRYTVSRDQLHQNENYNLKGVRSCHPKICHFRVLIILSRGIWQTVDAQRVLWSPAFYLRAGHKISCKESALPAPARGKHSYHQK